MLIQGFDPTADFAIALLIHYSFDLGGCTASELIDRWTHDYSTTWIRSAVIEALYQGRYKSISVEQILAFWQRRELALHHFSHEFECLVCDNLPQTLAGQFETTANAAASEQNKAVLSNGNNAVVTASDAGEEMAVKIVDPTANIPSVNNSFAKEMTQYSHQPNDHEKSRRRSGSPILPSSAIHPPIEHFTPQTDDSGDFYTKLKVLAQNPEAKQQT